MKNNGLSVLVVEDELVTRKFHEELLKKQRLPSVSATTFENFEDTIERMGAEIFGIITDDEIPNAQGNQPSSHSREVIKKALSVGVLEENICLSSGVIDAMPEYPLVTIVPKKQGYLGNIHDFIKLLKKRMVENI